MHYYYDTCSLLRLQEKVFDTPFTISTVTIDEIENLKTSKYRTEETKAQARNILRLLNRNWGKYTADIVDYQKALKWWEDHGTLETYNISNDRLIIASAAMYQAAKPDVQFVTDDLCCKTLAMAYGVRCGAVENKPEYYSGYKSIAMSEAEMSAFYTDTTKNVYNLKRNQYIRVLNDQNKLVDVRKWDGEKHVALYDRGIKSDAFGTKIKPRDEYQQMAVDSIVSNTLTVLTGKPGSGKSLIALATFIHLIEKGIYDRIVMMTNPCKVRGTTDLGYYAGDLQRKLMQSSIGNILITKFGDRIAVDDMIAQNKLVLLSIADCRGMEVRDNEILYVSEAQNMTVDMVKLLLARASQGCKVVLEGDFDTQVDNAAFAGINNGMRRVIDTFRGNPLFGYVDLPNVWRSKLAELAQEL